MRLVPLTQGEFALVDDADFDRVAAHKWCLHRSSKTGPKYAVSGSRTVGQILMHRFILDLPRWGPDVDHQDGNGLNNQRSNLRIATKSQNGMNRPRVKTKSSSRFKGCYKRASGNWQAMIHVNGRNRGLGTFPTEEMAAAAYNVAARTEFGEFARLNDVQDVALTPAVVVPSARGTFTNDEDAARAYDAAALKYFGADAWLSRGQRWLRLPLRSEDE